MKKVRRVANRAVLASTVLILENVQNALLGSTKVKKIKSFASSVKMVAHQINKRQLAKNQITKSKKTATTTTNTSTAHLQTQTIGHVSRVHLAPLALVTLHGIKSRPSMVIGD